MLNIPPGKDLASASMPPVYGRSQEKQMMMANSSQPGETAQLGDQNALLAQLHDELADLRQQVAEQHAEIQRLLRQMQESCCPWSGQPWHREH